MNRWQRTPWHLRLVGFEKYRRRAASYGPDGLKYDGHWVYSSDSSAVIRAVDVRRSQSSAS